MKKKPQKSSRFAPHTLIILCTLVTVLILCVLTAFSQSQSRDSLYNRLLASQSDSASVVALEDLGDSYRGTIKDSALQYYQLEYALAKKIHLTKYEIVAESRSASVLNESENFIESLQLSQDALQKEQQAGDTAEMFFTMREICWTYGYVNDFAKQFASTKELLVFAHAPFFRHQPNFEEIAINTLGVAYERLNLIDSAITEYEYAYHGWDHYEDQQGIAVAAGEIAFCLEKKNQLDSAAYYLRVGNAAAKAADRQDLIPENNLRLAEIFYKRGLLDSAFVYAYRSLSQFKSNQDTSEMTQSSQLLAQLYRIKKMPDSTSAYLALTVSWQDSVMRSEYRTKSANFRLFANLQQQRLQQEKIDAAAQYQSRVRIIALSAAFAFALVLAIFLFRSNRRKQQAKLKIETAYQELKSAQAQLIHSEKMASLGALTAGIAHEIQNPLNFVNNFSDINIELSDELQSAARKGNLEEIRSIASEIRSNEQKINLHGNRADGIVKAMLQHSRSGSGTKELTDINKLLEEYSRLAYHGARAKDNEFNVTYDTSLDENIPKLNIVPQDLGRVLLNLLTNALYAVAERKRGLGEGFEPRVSISTKKETGKVLIIVRDNGEGIPSANIDKIFQPFFTTKPAGQGTGLGLSLSYDIIKAQGGTISVKSQDGVGTSFTIELPYDVKSRV